MNELAVHPGAPRSGHPIEEFLGAALEGLKALADTPTWSLDAAAATRCIQLAARLAAALTELEARTITHAAEAGLPAAAGCRDTRRWLQRTTGVSRRAAAAKTRHAAALAAHEATRAACARGDLHAEQARAVTDHLDRLDDERVSRSDQARAETFLLDHAAAGHDADDLAQLGHAVWQHLDPDGADEREARALEAQEERARAKTRLTMADDGAGLTHGRFTLPSHVAAAFRKQLHAFAAPKHVRATQGAGAFDWQTPSASKLGQALVEWIETYEPTRLPKIGGLSATVVVIGDYDLLTGTVRAATLETGHRISHTEFLRLACAAGVIPSWMNADGECLALGRTHRFHTPAQRLAAIVEQRTCLRPGCDVPGYLCHLHHRDPWSEGGGTDLRTTELLCPFHHHQTHAAGDHHPQQN
jgi:hypothetical protein